mmetsp:Transcript_20183/g.81105  ORF Transcript_20183/g.81105 Transcript_20183/m.81105 type:complete len:96 (-) Transcript_20183:3005-3292(-)
MMSQVRGPYCAKLFHRELVKANVEPLPKVTTPGWEAAIPTCTMRSTHTTKIQFASCVPTKVSILDGGFEDFVVQHHHEKDLFEDLNERKWGFNTN